MSEKQYSTSILLGLQFLTEEDMKKLLFDIATYEIDGDLEKCIRFAHDARTSISKKILERMKDFRHDGFPGTESLDNITNIE